MEVTALEGCPFLQSACIKVGQGQLTPTPQVTEAAKLGKCQAHGAGTGWSSEMQRTLYTLWSQPALNTLLTLQGRSIFVPLSRTWEVPQTFRAGEPNHRASQSPQDWVSDASLLSAKTTINASQEQCSRQCILGFWAPSNQGPAEVGFLQLEAKALWRI